MAGISALQMIPSGGLAFWEEQLIPHTIVTAVKHSGQVPSNTLSANVSISYIENWNHE